MVTFLLIILYAVPAVTIIGVPMYGIAMYDRSNRERVESLRNYWSK